jgi:hypothetical protein
MTDKDTIDKTQKLVSIILEHYDNNPNCEHCKEILKGVFE